MPYPPRLPPGLFSFFTDRTDTVPMLPPKDIPPSELFLKLLETPPSEVIDFPRKTAAGVPIGKLRVRVLGQEQHDQARIDGHRAMKARGLDAEDLRSDTIREVTGDTVAREILAMACLTDTGLEGPDEVPMYARIFRNADDLKKLRPDELSVLFNAYLMVQAKFGPFERTIGDDADLNAWIKRLGEGGSEFPLLRKGYPDLAQLAFSLAVRAYTLSVILDSLWPSLPDTLRVVLEKFSMGTGFYGEPAASSIRTTTENSDEVVTQQPFVDEMTEQVTKLEEIEDISRRLKSFLVTTEAAARMAQAAKAKEE